MTNKIYQHSTIEGTKLKTLAYLFAYSNLTIFFINMNKENSNIFYIIKKINKKLNFCDNTL